jgi:Fur family peroxide stress response transcriptional regulator
LSVTPPIDEVLRDRGLKVTPQRLAVHRAVLESVGHPDAEEIWAAVRTELPNISLRTVYEVLHTLADLGEIREVDLATGSSRFDPTTSDHHHLVCTRCGAVADVFLDGPAVQVPAVQQQGFTVDTYEIAFRGLCQRCSDQTRQDRELTDERRSTT